MSKINEIAAQEAHLGLLRAEFARRGELPQEVDPHRNIGRQLYNLTLLGEEQRDLLDLMVRAQRAVPRNERSKFVLLDLQVGARLMHPGFNGRWEGDIYVGDLEVLTRAGLLAETKDDHDRLFDVTPHGFAYMDYVMGPGSSSPEAGEGEAEIGDQGS